LPGFQVLQNPLRIHAARRRLAAAGQPMPANLFQFPHAHFRVEA
jgi:hypothetical protein